MIGASEFAGRGKGGAVVALEPTDAPIAGVLPVDNVDKRATLLACGLW